MTEDRKLKIFLISCAMQSICEQCRTLKLLCCHFKIKLLLCTTWWQHSATLMQRFNRTRNRHLDQLCVHLRCSNSWSFNEHVYFLKCVKSSHISGESLQSLGPTNISLQIRFTRHFNNITLIVCAPFGGTGIWDQFIYWAVNMFTKFSSGNSTYILFCHALSAVEHN